MSDPVRENAPPVEIAEGAARSFAYGYPLVLLSACAVRFGALVANPDSELLCSLGPLAVLQILYAALCLPMKGAEQAGPKGKKAARKNVWTWFYTVVFAALCAIAAVAAGFIIAAVMVLLGAPVTDKGYTTMLCAWHMGLLTTVPALHVWGIEPARIREVLGLSRPLDEVYGSLLGTLVGAWLGAIPIPLDWDRDWQKYPITIVVGAYIGHAAGFYLGGCFRGKKIHIKA